MKDLDDKRDSLAQRLAEKVAGRKGSNVSKVLQMLQDQTLVAILMVSSQCNAKCKHCYLPYEGTRSPEDTLDAVTKLQQDGHSVIIAGSENLMNPMYLESYQKAGQNNILTNGLLLHQDKSLYKQLKEHGIELINLSLHFGIDDVLRSISEEMVADVVRDAKEREFTVQITTTITSQNYRSVEEMCEKAEAFGADRIHFGRFVLLGRGRDNAELVLSNEQVAQFFEQMVQVRAKYDNLKIRAEGYFGPRPDSIGEELAAINCYCPAGSRVVAIDPDNNVYGCPLSMGKEHIIGRFEDKIIIDKQVLPERRDTCIAHLIHS